MMTIDFYDGEDVYGRIETEEDPEKIEKLLDKYKSLNPEEYHIDGFYEFLEKKGIEFDIMNIEADRKIYF